MDEKPILVFMSQRLCNQTQQYFDAKYLAKSVTILDRSNTNGMLESPSPW